MNVPGLPFPDRQPPGYEWFENEVTFDPARHLALEAPKRVRYLDEFGYGDDDMLGKATRFAVSDAFRVLSDEGAAVLLDTARRLRRYAVSCERIDTLVRSGCYRSRFLRDLCLSPQVNDLLSDIYEVEIAPHTMPVHLGHLNFAPDDVSRAIDRWHHDTLPLDYVMTVTDPADYAGGRFEYFVGTKQEAAALAQAGKTPPPERIVAPQLPAAGYAVALHGDMIVHRAGVLEKAAERITMVNGYVAVNTALDEQSRTRDLVAVDDPVCLYTEWARHAAWRTRGKLDALIDELEFTDDREKVITELEAAVREANAAIKEMREADGQLQHYGG